MSSLHEANKKIAALQTELAKLKTRDNASIVAAKEQEKLIDALSATDKELSKVKKENEALKKELSASKSQLSEAQEELTSALEALINDD